MFLQWPFVGDMWGAVEVFQKLGLEISGVVLRRKFSNGHSSLPGQSSLDQYSYTQQMVLKWPFRSPRTKLFKSVTLYSPDKS